MPKISFQDYKTTGSFDEMFTEDGTIRPPYDLFKERLLRMDWKRLNSLQYATDRAQLSLGMTFNVYSDNQGIERILHLDIIPRIITAEDWNYLERGLKQRIHALNLFINDIYNDQKVLKDKVIPRRVDPFQCNIPQRVLRNYTPGRCLVPHYRHGHDPGW